MEDVTKLSRSAAGMPRQVEDAGEASALLRLGTPGPGPDQESKQESKPKRKYKSRVIAPQERRGKRPPPEEPATHAQKIAARLGIDLETTPVGACPELDRALNREPDLPVAINNEHSIQDRNERWGIEKNARPLRWTPELEEAALRLAAGQNRHDVARAVGLPCRRIVECEDNLEFQAKMRWLVGEYDLVTSTDVALSQARGMVALERELFARIDAGQIDDMDTVDVVRQLRQFQKDRLRTVAHKYQIEKSRLEISGQKNGTAIENKIINIVVGQITNLNDEGRRRLAREQDDLLALAGIIDVEPEENSEAGGA